MQANQSSRLSGALARQVIYCFAGAYLLSYAFRSINAVIAPALVADLGLSNADLGLLSSAYFVAFASLQLPLGIWLDKYGPRRTECTLLMFAAAGAAVFAMSSSLLELWIGRALIGIGVSACLMAPLKAYRQWYSPGRQSQLGSWMLVAGTSGALASTMPVTAAMPVIGWRGVFWLMAGLILLAAAFIYLFVGRAERQLATLTPSSATRDQSLAGGYGPIFSSSYFRRMALLGMVNVGSFMALQTLWAGPWMTTVLKMSTSQTSQILFLFNLVLLLAYLGMAWWAPRHIAYEAGARGWPALQAAAVGLGGTIAVQALMLLTSASWSWILWLVLALLFTSMILAQTHVSLSFPPALAGRANSAYNLSVFVGAFAMQWGLGLLADAFERYGFGPADALRSAFGVCVGLQAAALAIFILRMPDSSQNNAILAARVSQSD